MKNLELDEKLVNKKQNFKLIKKGIFVLSVPLIATFTNGCQTEPIPQIKTAVQSVEQVSTLKDELREIFLIVGGVIAVPPYIFFGLKELLEDLEMHKMEKRKREEQMTNASSEVKIKTRKK